MNLLQTWQAFVTGIDEHRLLARLIFASIELTILAVAVALLLRFVRPRTPRFVVFLWALVLAKPLLTLVIGSPVHVVQLSVPAQELIIAAAPSTTVDSRTSAGWSSNAGNAHELPTREIQGPENSSRHLEQSSIEESALQSPTMRSSSWWQFSAVSWLWLIGVAVMLIRSIQIRHQLARILAGCHVPSPGVNESYLRLAASMKVRKPPQLLVTSELESPALVRLWQTTILVPAWLVALADQSALSWSLRHELTHAKHGDLWLIRLRQLSRAVFFFHPVAWWAGRQLEEALEIACDRAVITSDADATDYANRLYQILDAVRHHHRRPLSSGLFATRSQIAKRLLMLVEAPMRLRPKLSRASVIGLTLLATLVLAVGIGLNNGSSVAAQPADKEVPLGKQAAESKDGSDAKSTDTSSADTRSSKLAHPNQGESKTTETQSSESKIEATTRLPDDVSRPTPSEQAQIPTGIQDVAADRPKMSGVVSTPDGQPISGALISIYSAGVRVGTSPYCPTCYADCGKRATTDKDGTFVIERLDPTLIFKVLVVAKGYEPQFVNKVDPLENKNLAVVLNARPTLPDDRRQIVVGQVVGPSGKPLAGALVEPFGCKSGARRWWGSLPGIDPLSVTDDDGRFEIVSSQPIEGLDLQISARAMVPRKFALVPTGADSNQFQLSEGATVSGRVLDHNKPVAGILVGLVQADRRPESFTGPLQVGTDADGRFSFANVSGGDYFVYGLMNGLRQRGAVVAKRVHAFGDNTQTDAGDLAVESASSITGRLVLSDGKPLPAHTRVLLSLEDAWDSQAVEINAAGEFAVQGIPRSIISITASVPGYRVSDKNKSLEPLNGWALKGLVSDDIKDLIVLFEPGKREMPVWPTSPIEQRALSRTLERLKIEPLVGVTADLQAPPESDPVVSEAPVITRKPLPHIDVPTPRPALPAADADVPKRTVVGRVTDTDGNSITGAEVWLPLHWVSADHFLTAHAKCGNGGHFELMFPAAWVSDDVTQIQSTVWAYAPGHSIGIGKIFAQLRDQKSGEPCEIQLGPPADTNFTVLLPDGKPAVGFQVQPQHYLGSSAYEYVPSAIVAMTTATTDNDGHVTLPAFPLEKLLNVNVSSEDFGTQQFNSLRQPRDAQSELKLMPVGRIEGHIVADQPELFRDIVVSFETDNDPTLNGKGEALLTVGQDGRFVVPHIAAGWIEIYASIDERLPVRPRLPDRRQLEVVPGKTTRMEIPLELAVHAHGVIRVKGSGEPVCGTNISVAYGGGRQSDQVISDDAGRYSAYVLPGNIRLQVIHIPQGGLTQPLDSRSDSHTVPEGVAEFELPPLELTKTIKVTGHLLDSDGKSLPKRRINGLVGNSRYGWGQSDKNGDFVLSDVPEGTTLEHFQVWADDPRQRPIESTVESTDPLVIRVK